MDLPVGLTGEADVVEFTAIIFGVSSSQQQLPAGIGIWVPETDRRQTSVSAFEEDNLLLYLQYQKVFIQQIVCLYMTFEIFVKFSF